MSSPDLHDAIDEVPWSRLFHAYGPAVDTPGHLHNLAAGRQLPDAAWHFESAIVHQCTVWSASPDGFRLLVRVMRERELPTDIVDRLLDTLIEAADNFENQIESPTTEEVEAALQAWEQELAAAHYPGKQVTNFRGQKSHKDADQLAYEAFMHRRPQAWDLIRYAVTGVQRLRPDVLELLDALDAQGAASPELVNEAREAWGAG